MVLPPHPRPAQARRRPSTRASGAALLLVLGACFGWTRDPEGRPEYLADYINSHYDDLGQRFVAPLRREQLRQRLETTRVLFLGDHHRDPRLHAEMLELITWIADQGLRPILGIEAIGTQDNASLQEYLADDIDLARLRRRVAARWPHTWLDSSEVDYRFFRSLLARAKQRQIPVFALEPTPRLDLSSRDTLIAGNIRRALQLYPDRLIVVVVGHAHLLGKGHLIGRVGASTLAVAARFSPILNRLARTQRRVEASSFLQTDCGVLFFPSTPVRSGATTDNPANSK